MAWNHLLGCDTLQSGRQVPPTFWKTQCLSCWTNRLISTLKTEAAGNPPTCWWICTTLWYIMSRGQIFKHVHTHFHISLPHYILKYFYRSSSRKYTSQLHAQPVRHYIWFEKDCNKVTITSQTDRWMDVCVRVHTILKHTLRYPK